MSRISVWLVSPAWRRFAVTQLALTQRELLAGELAARGIDCRTVIVADDENLEIARERGCATVEMNNKALGRRFNAGYTYAARQGADYFVHIGSDDWAHPSLFEPLTSGVLHPRAIVTGRQIAFVDLFTGRMRHADVAGPRGVIPWIIPRVLLETVDFAPIPRKKQRGIDGNLANALRRARAKARWHFHDPHSAARVDFKSDVNLNTFDKVTTALGATEDTDAWTVLAEHYPEALVDLARRTHRQVKGVA